MKTRPEHMEMTRQEAIEVARAMYAWMSKNPTWAKEAKALQTLLEGK